MSKISIEVKRSRPKSDGRAPLKLTPRDMRSLYFLREPYVDQIVDTAVMLDEHDRKLAVRMLQALIEHRRSSLS
jgi:hypothetical protein